MRIDRALFHVLTSSLSVGSCQDSFSELLTPDEGGAGFAKRYFDAIQASPDVAMAHAEARRAIVAVRSPAR
jgi:hypothetical protein